MGKKIKSTKLGKDKEVVLGKGNVVILGERKKVCGSGKEYFVSPGKGRKSVGLGKENVLMWGKKLSVRFWNNKVKYVNLAQRRSN